MTMPAKKQDGVDDAEVLGSKRLNVRLPLATYKRLLIHAVQAGEQPGELLTSLIETHLRVWKVQANTTSRGKSDDRLDLAGELSSRVANVA
jgi:hypothetical protein